MALSALVGCSSTVEEKVSEPYVTSRGTSPYGEVDYVETSQRAGARQPFLVIHVPSPRGTAILYTGSPGRAGLKNGGNLSRGGNFLIRSRLDFAAAGYNVAVVDSPSDRDTLRFFRTTAAHALDGKGVIAYMRKLSNGPVWLIGTSCGSVSVASITSRLAEGRAAGEPNPGPDGIVLTSSVAKGQCDGETNVYSANLSVIHVPVLVVSHTADLCPSSAMSASLVLTDKLKETAPVAEFQSFSGGNPPESGSCEPFSPHGFFGIEQQVTGAITTWMKAHEGR